MSSMKSLLENLNSLDRQSSNESQSCLQEESILLKEWEDFKESYYHGDSKKPYLGMYIDGKLVAKFEDTLEGRNEGIEILIDLIREHPESQIELKRGSTSLEEEQLDEIVPALAAVGGALARGAAAAGGAVARGVANVARSAAPAVKNVAQTAAKSLVGQAIKSTVGGGTTQQPQQQQPTDTTQDKAAGEKLAKDTAANIQKIKSSTGANINVPGVTQSILKAAAGQQMNPGDTKNLSTLMDPLTKTLADPAKAKKLSDIFRTP